jgi:hypothetical protein
MGGYLDGPRALRARNINMNDAERRRGGDAMWRFVALMLVVLPTPAFGAADLLQVVCTETTDAVLTVGTKNTSIKARVSFALTATPADLKAGRLSVVQFNVVGLAVPQRELTGKEPRGKKAGPLGFSITPGGVHPTLRYDAKRPGISGKLTGRVGFPQLEELFPPKHDPKTDVYTIPTQEAELEIDLKLERPIDLVAAGSKIVKLLGSLDFSQIAPPDKELMLPRNRINGRSTRAFIEYTFMQRIEATRTLCIQPVAIRDNARDPNPTGAGLEFGLPAARSEWGKADIRLSVRPWMYIENSAFRVASALERDEIRDSVNEDDCIEVFFTERFTSNDNGGGETTGSGTVAAKIVSSDENAAVGVDLHHLAHELGHVLSLLHPDRPDAGRPWMIPGSTGTLMCPSGFGNDNPDPNSQENKDNVQNPLLVASLGARGPDADCADSADCGACP